MPRLEVPTATAPVRLRSYPRARDAWPLDTGVVHLNHGSFGAVPREVLAVQDDLRRQAHASPVGWFPRLAERIAAARAATAPFVGVDPDDVAFVPNASAAATVAFNALQLEPGDEILVTSQGYGAVTMGAARLARRCGAIMRTLPLGILDDDESVIAQFAEAITPRTRLIIVDQITSPTARVMPTSAITALAHDRGVRVLVDGAHAPGLIPIAAAAGGGDWWFGNMHKWPCAPQGSALFVTRAHDRDDLWPLIDSWAPDAPFPGRFDSQGTIDATSYLATPDAISFIEREHGWENARREMSRIADEGAHLISNAFDRYSDTPSLVSLPSPVPSMRLIRLPEGLGSDRGATDGLREQLFDEVGVETAFSSVDGHTFFRLSVHLYTEASDFEAFIDRCVPRILRLAGL